MPCRRPRQSDDWALDTITAVATRQSLSRAAYCRSQFRAGAAVGCGIFTDLMEGAA